MHGNTHFPIMVGAAKRFEDTGEGLYKTIVLNFIDVLERTQNFASGGSTFGEHWGSGNLGGIASGVEGWGQDSQVRMCTPLPPCARPPCPPCSPRSRPRSP